MATLAYAFIDQVWDGTTAKSNNIKASKGSSTKTLKDPACALYKRRKQPAYNKNYDDVIDAYLNDNGNSTNPTGGDVMPSSDVGLGMLGRSVIPGEDEFNDVSFYKPQPQGSSASRCNTQPMPLQSDAIDTQLEYDRFFSDDQLFDASRPNKPYTSQEQQHQTQDEEYPQMQQHYAIQEEAPSYSHSPNMYQYYAPPLPQHQQTQVAAAPWVEILLFVASGIILIFILEQVLQMGVYLR